MERGASIGLSPVFTFGRSDVVLGAGTRARISWSLDRALLTKARSVKSPGLLDLVEIDFDRFAQLCSHWAILVFASDLFKAARFVRKVTQRSAALVQLVRRFT